ncbi:cell division protein FtsA [Halanaerobacter jeridensis]|uniref:Cell division protein FtsA n=1 Tax=Halanaerobacter jeridensis TaxID=706427 RepID=A0A938XPH3_9FIRM|nr:cell division FtsA domain-containing protein [Halanaerobacter jeridensis]MBM7556602.1 cell division protein FtsA [Halanaerobacter jeridensis]
MNQKNDNIFALDIGTRTIVGAILERDEDQQLNLKASQVIEHQNRSMLDGQIHNVMEVAEQVKKIKKNLEEECATTLNKVGIAAAGRALKTVKSSHQIDFKSKKEIKQEDIRMLEFGAVQNAQQELASHENQNTANGYHFVGYTVLESNLDGIKVESLLGQSGKGIEVEVIATFLPRIVVDSLLTVIREAELEVEHLTLEPIAASQLVVPKQMYNFNLALIDIGAGTSDIAITEDGSIIGYAMVPVAGDEITEAICENYMVDYHHAEKIKRQLQTEDAVTMTNILDQEEEIPSSNVIDKIEATVDELARLIGEEIINLNGSQPQAVMCIGGGSLTPLLEEKLAENLDLPQARIGVKDIENIDRVTGEIEELAGSQAVTPFGIAVSCYENMNRANFLDVEVNGDRVHLFTLTEPRVADALLAAEIDLKALKAEPGMALSVEVNGELKMIRGTMGEKGRILLNGEEVDIETTITQGDQLVVELGEQGKAATGEIRDVVPELPTREVTINGTAVEIEPIYYMNGKKVGAETELEDRAEVTYDILQTVGEIIEEILELPTSKIRTKTITYTLNGEEKQYQRQNYQIVLNGEDVDLRAEVDEGDELVIEENEAELLTIADVIEQQDIDNDLEIIFNGRKIEVPNLNQKLLKNGQTATKDDLVGSGDEIEYKAGGIRLNQLLNHINYDISNISAGKLKVKKNGEEINFTEQLIDGDEVELYIENSAQDQREEVKKEINKTDSLVQLKRKLNQKINN